MGAIEELAARLFGSYDRYHGYHPTWRYINEWVDRMARQYGGVVFDREAPSKSWDWGQALMRQIYGVEWNSNPDKNWIDQNTDIHEPAPDHWVQAAKEWDAGNIPEWVIFQEEYENR